MSVEQKRTEVLEKVYDRLLEYDGLEEYFGDGKFGYSADGKKLVKQCPSIQLIVALENASEADKEIQRKEKELESKALEVGLKERELDLKASELQLKEKEFTARENQDLVDNAARDMDRHNQLKVEVLRAVSAAGASILTTVIWSAIFTHELRATRLFEKDGTEVSAAGRWLKNSFPKPRVF